MEQLRRAFVMVSAAILASQVGTKAAQAEPASDDKDAKPPEDSGPKEGDKKKPAERAKDGKRRPPEWEPDLNMPAGTAYDVIGLDDVP